MRSGLSRTEIQPNLRQLVSEMYHHIPTGVGRGRKDLRLGHQELKAVLRQGAAWAVKRGMGEQRDLEFLEEGGCIAGADPDRVSKRALERGQGQLGTLGSGNHFAEIQYVAKILDETAAAALGLFEDQITVTIHSGSRGLWAIRSARIISG